MLAASCLLASCETTESTAPAETATEWLIEPSAQGDRGAYLEIGMPKEAVREQLGKTARVIRPKKDAGATEIWEYRRDVLGPIGYNIVNSGSSSGTLKKNSRWVETVTIRFVDGLIAAVDVKRRTETKDAVTPPFGPNAR